MSPLVSILIPAFNSERWIAATIASALGQSWPRTEIIVVDDGSADGTLAAARQFESRSVVVHHQQNQGAAAARNKAFLLSRGDYIQWLDADDLLAPDKIERQMVEAERDPSRGLLLSGAWGRFIYRTSKARFDPTALWQDLSPVEWLTRKLGQSLYMQPGSWLVSRKLTELAGPWDTRLSLDDDGDYFCRVVKASRAIRFVRDARVFYRRGFESLSYIGMSSRKLDSQFLAIQLQMDCLRSVRDDDAVRSACLSYLQDWLPFFHPERADLVRKMQDKAAELGGALTLPDLPWKYRLLQNIFGLTFAKRTRARYNQLKSAAIRNWDKAWFHLEGGRQSNNVAMLPANRPLPALL
jgi:glycosyltransferase involved in cell wall biosynthesis